MTTLLRPAPRSGRALRSVLLSSAVLALVASTGCVVEHGGMDEPDDLGSPIGTLPGGGNPNGPKPPDTGDRQVPGDDNPVDDNPVDDNPVDDNPVDDDPVDDGPAEPTMMESTRHNLVWKRYRAVERDLMRALSLQKEQLCNELGQYSCIDVVHLAPLGGNEPFELGQYEPVEAPTATTATAFDRVVLSGCVARVDQDSTTSNPAVFGDLDLSKASVSAAADGEALDATVTTLYRRLLSRDPTPGELTAARGLADDGPSAKTFAVTACYAIGTTVENLFF